jgi:hypothetical protein
MVAAPASLAIPEAGGYPSLVGTTNPSPPVAKASSTGAAEVVTEAASIEGGTSLKRLLVLASMALLPLSSMSSAEADSERSFFGLRSFVGLWEGIDPVDGGDSLRSITCSRDRSCKLAATDSVITLCGGGAAFASGTGGLEGDELVFPDAVLTCPDGTAVDLAISYERDPLNRTLVETTVVVETGTTLPNIIFHKISR